MTRRRSTGVWGVLVILVVLVWLMTRQGRGDAPTPVYVADGPRAARSVPEGEAAGPAPARSVTGGQRDPAGRSGVESVVTFRGRVVTLADALPLAGATVVLANRFSADRSVVDEVSATTGVDGRFELANSPRRSHLMAVTIISEGHATVTGSWWAKTDGIEAGDIVECGDIGVPRGGEVVVRAREESGAPVSGFAFDVRLPTIALPGQGRFQLARLDDLATGDDGESGPHAVPLGEVTVAWPDQTHEARGPRPRQVVVDRFAPPYVLELAVRPLDASESVHGTVVDQHGDPVPRALVRADGASNAITRGDGTFALRCEREMVSAFEVLDGHGDGARHLPVLESEENVAAGARNVTVVVERFDRLPRHTVRFDVVNGRTGEPLADFRAGVAVVEPTDPLRFRDVGPGMQRFERVQEVAPSESGTGRIVLAGLAATRHVLLVAPADPELRPLLTHTFVAEPNAHERIVVEPAVPRSVRVVSEWDGSPIAGSTVSLLRGLGGRQVERPQRLDDVSFIELHELLTGHHGAVVDVRAARATTGGDGRAVLRTAPDVDGALLLVQGKLHEPAAEPLAAARDIVVRVRPAASIVGRVIPEDVLDGMRALADVPLRVIVRDAGPVLPAQRWSCEVDEQGRFALHSIACPPAGADFELVFEGPGFHGFAVETPVDDLHPGEQRTIELDVSRVAPVPVDLRFRFQGVLLDEPRADVVLLGRALQDVVHEGHARVHLPPGRHIVGLHVEGEGVLWPATRVHVPERGPVSATLDLWATPLTVRVVDRDGDPAPEGTTVQLVAEDPHVQPSVVFDASVDQRGTGSGVLRYAGPVSARVGRANSMADVGPLVVLRTASPQQVELRVDTDHAPR